MNERIAELKAQCIVREQRGTNAFDNYMVDRFDTERFAKLIVLKCAEIADTAEPFLSSDLIKQHFGVVE
jgi:hypothetical protein